MEACIHHGLDLLRWNDQLQIGPPSRGYTVAKIIDIITNIECWEIWLREIAIIHAIFFATHHIGFGLGVISSYGCLFDSSS